MRPVARSHCLIRFVDGIENWVVPSENGFSHGSVHRTSKKCIKSVIKRLTLIGLFQADHSQNVLVNGSKTLTQMKF